jgi:L-ribulokinase
MVKIIGTSACDCSTIRAGRALRAIPGICGVVRDAVVPGSHAIEAGQSAVGDIFKWWVERVCGGDSTLHRAFSREAATHAPGQSGLLALDWHNGNRNLLCDPLLSGVLVGCTLHTTRAEIYRALVEATAFGARMILERLRECGVPVRRVVCAGGIAEKNPLLMQIYADVLGCTMERAASKHACALGSAVAAAIVAGVHADFPAAQSAMVRVARVRYRPTARNRKIYDRLFAHYRNLHDAFGREKGGADLSALMKDLLILKSSSLRAAMRRQPPL